MFKEHDKRNTNKRETQKFLENMIYWSCLVLECPVTAERKERNKSRDVKVSKILNTWSIKGAFH